MGDPGHPRTGYFNFVYQPMPGPDGTPYPMAECPIDRALPTRAQEQGEDVFVRRDGSFYPVAFTASPILEDGKATGPSSS